MAIGKIFAIGLVMASGSLAVGVDRSGEIDGSHHDDGIPTAVH